MEKLNYIIIIISVFEHPKKNKKSFFIHRHDIGWIESPVKKKLIHIGSKIS